MIKYKVNKIYVPFLFCFDLMCSIIFRPFRFLIKKPKSINNILILKNDYIGDMVLATPFFFEAKKRYPDSKITVLCRSSSSSVLQNNPNVDEVICLNTPWLHKNDSCGYFNVLRFTLQNFRKYDLVYDLHTEPRNILLACLLGRYSIGYRYRGLGFLLSEHIVCDHSQHMILQNLNLLGCNKISSPQIFLSETEKSQAKQLITSLNMSKPIMGINPGTTDQKRQWPLHNFNKLIKELQQSYCVLVFDNDIKRSTIVCKGTNAINMAGKVSLREYFALIPECGKVICLESMSSHVASAFRIPSIVIYSSTTDLNVMSPYGNSSILINSEQRCTHCNAKICTRNDAIKNVQVHEILSKVATWD